METSAAPQVPFLSSLDKKHFISGQWQPSLAGESIPTFNLANGRQLATLARGRSEDADAAVACARRPFEGPWSRFTPHERNVLMLRICELLDRNFEELATLDSLDMRRPLAQTRAMKKSVMHTILYFAGQTTSWTGSTIPNSLAGPYTTLPLKAPVGVIDEIIPWNSPLISMWWTMGGILTTGCTGVIKPAQDASLSTLRTAELLVEVGLASAVWTTNVSRMMKAMHGIRSGRVYVNCYGQLDPAVASAASKAAMASRAAPMKHLARGPDHRRPVRHEDYVELSIHPDRAEGMWFPLALDSFDFLHEVDGYLGRISAKDHVLGA